MQALLCFDITQCGSYIVWKTDSGADISPFIFCTCFHLFHRSALAAFASCLFLHTAELLNPVEYILNLQAVKLAVGK